MTSMVWPLQIEPQQPEKSPRMPDDGVVTPRAKPNRETPPAGDALSDEFANLLVRRRSLRAQALRRRYQGLLPADELPHLLD